MNIARLLNILVTMLLLCTVAVVVPSAAPAPDSSAAQGRAPSLSATRQGNPLGKSRGQQATPLAGAGGPRLWGLSGSTARANGAFGHRLAPTGVERFSEAPYLNLDRETGPLEGLRTWDPLPESMNYAYLPLIQCPNPDDIPGWDIVMKDDFEGSWPGPWQLDYNPGTNPYLWAKRDCRPYDGGHSAWVAGDHPDSLLPCGANYPHNLFTYMMYGPFSLADAVAAELTFKVWLNSELSYDQMYWGAARDGNDFWGFFSSGNTNGWEEVSLDLRYIPSLGNLTGRRQVWILLAFVSDGSQSLPEGVYVDDVLLRKTSLIQEEVVWQEFSFSEIGTPARGCAPRDPEGLPCSQAPNAEFAGAPPWTLSVPSGGATLKVTDGWGSGDVFDVYDSGTWIGRTSEADLGANCLEPSGCYQQPRISSGEFSLAAGEHAITIVPISSPYGMGAAFFRMD